MTEMKYGLRYLIGIALIAGTLSVAGCGSSDTATRTTTTDQSTTSSPMMAPTTSTTTTSSTQQSHP
jgi:hypothetical protein